MAALSTARNPGRERRDEDGTARASALAQLLGAPRRAARVIDDVAACVGDDSDSVRQLAVAVLGEVSESGESGEQGTAVAAMVRALGDERSDQTRVMAAQALGRARARARSAVPALIDCLRQGGAGGELRWHASFALGRIGAPAVPALTAELGAACDPGVLAAVADALGWIGAGATAPDPSPGADGTAADEGRSLADAALRAVLRTTAKAAVKAALKKLGRGAGAEPKLHLALCSTLARVSGKVGDGLSPIAKTLQHENGDLRRAAVERIAELGPGARGAARDVGRCLADPSAGVRAAAVRALVRIGTEPGAAVAAIVPLCADQDAEVRAHAAIALCALGDGARPALGALARLGQDGDARVAAIAAAAAARIAGEDGAGEHGDRHDNRHDGGGS